MAHDYKPEIPKGLSREAFRHWYRTEYLFSEHWKRKANKKRKQMGFKCEICHKSGYDVHHLSYENLGNETMDDLQLLCRSCHSKIHEQEVAEEKHEPYSPITVETLTQEENEKIQEIIKEINILMENQPPFPLQGEIKINEN